MPMMFVVAGGVVAHPMGMDLASNFALAASTSNAQVAGWTPRSGFGSTVITSHKLVADGTGTWTLNAKATLTSGWSSATPLQIFIVKNSTTVATLSIAFSTTSATLTPQSISLVTGDTVQVNYTTPFGATGTLASGATNTYVYFS